VQATRARTREVLAGAPLDNGNVNARQRQLTRQHQPGRAGAGNQDIGIVHAHQATPLVAWRASARSHPHRRDEHARVSEGRFIRPQIAALQFLNSFGSAPYQCWDINLSKNLEWSADVRFRAHDGRNWDIAPLRELDRHADVARVDQRCTALNPAI
jgi:hypothetical protein